MLLIYLEDGRPFFFGHRRETKGGKEFLCWKFRSMRKDAEAIKAKLIEQNMADGPQFFMEEDPRLTRVGRVLRKLQVDEWPQFFNVLTGDMSVVGPRPSPHQENQFCPAWREARLSVRPGITGLWQVRRSRAHGLDFQEWIKYDIQYVEQQSLLFDLQIIFESVWMLVRYAWVAIADKLGIRTADDEAFVPGAEPIDVSATN
jgi:lipopolysaccharide/colanic/teichoic acid biosynthesis glycosyltransferase